MKLKKVLGMNTLNHNTLIYIDCSIDMMIVDEQIVSMHVVDVF